tara:strand:+ start:136 stop:480 length:345 start_codon:yes stop_codon:yes gene_type:complete
MENLSIIAQLTVSISIIIVWVFRYDNIVIEFKHYGYSDLLRNIVGASKISLATILILGIWYEELLFVSSLLMAFLMLCAQFSHFKVKNPIHKYIPSLFLLIFCLFIAGYNIGLI